MFGSIFGIFSKKRNKANVCYVKLPNTANKNIAQELKNLNSKL